MLNDTERKKCEIIVQVINGDLTRKEACEILKLSLKQIDRLKYIYKTKGENGFVHGNRGKNNPNKKEKSLIETLEQLYLTDFYDYNFVHFYEDYILGKYNISYSTMLKAFTNDDIISPLANKSTVKQYKEKMNEVINENNNKPSNEKIEIFKSRILQTEKAHTRRSNNLYVFGQEVQMDACEEYWFGGKVSFLHLAVDKATKKVLFGWFEFEEITRGYYVVLFHIIINYGIPNKITADNRSTFSANNAKNRKMKNFLTQFGKVCEKLNITLYTTSVATVKANVERENGTFKNRLIAELRHKGIVDIDAANDYLNNIFIPKMNQKFSFAIDEEKSLMRENTYTEEELKMIISERKDKIIDNASCISHNREYYVPVNPDDGEIVCFTKGTKCILILNYDGEYWSEIENHYYKMVKLESRDSVMKKESEINTEEKEHHKYIPPANHPWRKNMMLKH